MSGPIRLSQVLLEEYERLFLNSAPLRIPDLAQESKALEYQSIERPELLIERLRKADKDNDPAAFFLWTSLQPDTTDELRRFCGSQTQIQEVPNVLLVDINGLLQSRSFDIAPLTNDPRLSDLTKQFVMQVREDSQGKEVKFTSPFLKRLVLGDIFSDHLEKLPISEVHKLFHQLPEGATALCLSGGGIRSATLGLGLLQGLARFKLLQGFHYLSTVSGGGYIGSWLTAWIHRESNNHKEFDKALEQIGDALTKKTGNGLESDAAPITWLRKYRNYLSPNWSAFSTDTWTLLATYSRNLFLNWLVIIPALLGLLALPRLGVSLFTVNVNDWILSREVFLVLGTVFTTLSIAAITASMMQAQSSLARGESRKDCQASFPVACLILLTLSAVLLSIYWAYPQSPDHAQMIEFVLFAIGVHIAGALLGSIIYWICDQPGRNQPDTSLSDHSAWQNLTNIFWMVLAIFGASSVSGLAAWTAATEVFDKPSDNPHFYVTLAAPVLLLVFLLTGDLFLGFISRWKTDEHREWKARFNAYVLKTCAAWIGGSTLVLYGPRWLAEFQYPVLLSSFGGISGLLALLLGFSAKTKAIPTGEEKESTADTTRRWALSAAAPIGVIFVIVILSWCTSAMVLKLDPLWPFPHAREQMALPHDWSYIWLVAHIHQLIIQETSIVALFKFMGIGLVVSIFMALVVDINRFSLHSLYRDRLIRTFLGASNTKRNANWFTDMDPRDNIEMHEPASYGGRLFHVVNVAVNLLSSREQAWQDRKAASFTITPLHCGSPWPTLGYRRSWQYGCNKAKSKCISLGTALAISGAAASPNMGYHSSPAVTLLMSLFNIRLGWWLGNPGPAGDSRRWGWGWREAADPSWQRSTPRFSLLWWFKEALGQTREDNAYVYLSDGGHFENLGLYEMVLRRCRFIVVSDAGCDPTYSFEDLGNAIRKIRVDLGIDIEIDLDMVRPQAGQRFSRWHHAIGMIRYDKVDKNAPVGILVYIKASLTDDESADVLEYANAHGDFPHQSTGDQFFDESQFESYRQLGEQIAREVFNPIAADAFGKKSMSEMFYKLRSHWITLPPGIKESFLEESKGLLDIEQHLREDPNLLRYDIQLYPELKTILGISEFVADEGGTVPTTTGQIERSALHLCHAQIQLMQNVFLAVQLDKYHAHPLNRGWMNLFHRWAAAEEFQKLWPVLRGGFSKAFVDFAGSELNLGDSEQEVICEVTRNKTGNFQNPHKVPSYRGSAPTGLIDFEPVIREFWQQWPDKGKHHGFLKEFEKAGKPGHPPIIVAVPPLGVKTNSQVYGVAFAVDANTTDEPEPGWRVFIWIRGAHRRLGIGGKLLDHLITILKDLPPPSGSNGERKLIAILPELPRERPGYVLEKAGWLNFFGRRGFQLVHENKLYRLEGFIRDDAQQV